MPIILAALGAVVAWVGWIYISVEYQRKADAFDLSQMEKMEAASVIYDREGSELGKIFIQNRHVVPLDKMSPFMPKAVIAAEDNKFYTHGGVDYMGVFRAAVTNYRRGKIAQGASTVTQQLARNSFDSAELHAKTYQRKLLEMFLAERIEKNFSKAQIMELYLNRVYFGSGFYGVEAASRGYFGKSNKDLDPSQCAMLAGLLKNPNGLSPWNNKDGATKTRDFVLGRMKDQGFITSDELTSYLATPLYVMKRTNPFKVSYAVDYIRQQVIDALGYDRAMNGGFHIMTTLDIKIQKAAESGMRDVITKVESRQGYNHPTFESYRAMTKSIEDQINRGNMSVRMPEPKYLQGAVMALENSTGAVLAMVGGRDFKHSEYNRATMAKRPVGTAFAPFVYAAAYEKGIFPGRVVEDACLDNRYVMVGGDTGILGEWGVERADNEYEGPMPTRDALAKGKNAATVRLGLEIGLGEVGKVAQAAGLQKYKTDYANSLLGSSESSLEDLTLAYTIFPNGGMRPKQPYIIEQIKDSEGNPVYKATPEKVKAISPEAAYQVNMGLQDALRKGTGSIAFTEYGLKDMPIAGKTGTAYNFTDTYFLGYNSAVTCGVWVGFDKPTKIFRGAFGKDLALPIWTRIMNTAADVLPAVKFTKPDTLKAVDICRSSGLLATPQCLAVQGPDAGVYTEYATEEEIPQIRCDIHGGGVRDYAKDYGPEGDIPRAVANVDLSRVRPVAVAAPTLLGLNDVYNSVRPASQRFDDASIPVMKALPADSAQPATPAQAPSSDNPDHAVDPQAPQPPAADADPEVRKAEAVRPLDSPMDAPAIQAPTPEPINF